MSKVETSGHIHEMKDGIMHLYVKNDIPSIEAIKESMDYLKSLNQKLLIFFDPSDGIVFNREQRAFAAEEFNKFTIGFAMKDGSFTSKLIFRLISKFDEPDFPFKMVETEEEGINWLRSLIE